MKKLSILLLAPILLSLSCSSGGSEPPAGTPVPVAASPSGLQYQMPEGWVEEAPSSSMRVAQFKLPRAEGDPEDAELAVFHFQGGGGSTRANVERWVGQFSRPDGSPIEDAAVSEQELNGLQLTLVEVSGTYNASQGPMMAAGTPRPGFRMLAAVVEGPGGPWFLKLTGPEHTVQKWTESYHAFLQSLRAG